MMGHRYALAVDKVVQMISLRERHITPIPQTPAYFEGMVDLPSGPLGVLDLRALLGMPSMREETADVLQMLQQREQDHINWILELHASVRENREFTLATDPHKCKFGLWYDALMADYEGLYRFCNDSMPLIELMKSFDTPHQQIHQLAKQVSELVEAGEKEKALQVISKAESTTLAAMLDLFNKARTLIGELRRGIVVIAEQSSQHIGLQVDNVIEIRQFSETDHQTCITPGSFSSEPEDYIKDEQADALIQVIDLDDIEHRTKRHFSNAMALAT